MTKKQFKAIVKKMAEEGRNVYYFIGWLEGEFGLFKDKELDENMTKIYRNTHY